MRKGDIAVIGMAGRFPGAASVSEFWKNLIESKDCVTWLTNESLLEAGVAKADIEKSSYVKAAYLLDGYDTFDAEFFNVAPVDAELMDPQIRLVLQCAWNALEDAGYASLSPKNIGVFAGMGGVTTNYLSSFINRFTNIEKITASKTHTGNDKDFVANFISYKLNLTGPSVAVQTACSTSMVAVHQACSALLNDECEMCLAGGVNIRVPHAQGYEYKRGYIFSKSGRIRSFDAAADGVVFSNGVGLVLLKSLPKAIRDGDNIYAVVKGSAVTNDGKDKVSYTATNVNGQSRCIERALRNAGIDSGTIGFVESHGTGTAMGDPMEISALSQAFREGQAQKQSADDLGKCALGAVKTSIGHLDVAAGITGFIKTVLALHHRRIPPTLHFSQPNQRINFSETPFFINTDLLEWSAGDSPRRAGINSVGVGGTNAFAVLEEYVPKIRKPKGRLGPRWNRAIVPMSARSQESLRRYAGELSRFLDTRSAEGQSIELMDLAYTLQIGREALPCRCAILAESIEELRRDLALVSEGDAVAAEHILLPREKASGQAEEEERTAASRLSEWISDRNEKRIAEHWVAGFPVAWSGLFGSEKPKRISLPGYCFEAKRFWMDSQSLTQVAAAEEVIHPLLQRNISDWERQKYLSRFQGTEFFLAHHLVHGRKVLPGAACLEMARAALTSAIPSLGELGFLRLKNIEWIRPIEVASPSEVQLDLAETEGRDGSFGIGFRIHRPDRPGELSHCRGYADFLPGDHASSLDINSLSISAPSGVWEKEEIYKVFSEMGIGYGPAFQVLQTLQTGKEHLVARIALPKQFSQGSEDFALHPAQLDGAFQACTCLGLDMAGGRKEPPLPFALESLVLYRPCPAEMFAVVRYAAGSHPGDAIAKFDADLVDPTGSVCVELRGFTFRFPEQQRNAQRTQTTPTTGTQPGFPRLQAMVPVWNRLPDRESARQPFHPEQLFILHYAGSMLPNAIPDQYPSESISLNIQATPEEIAGQLQDRRFEQLLWIAPNAVNLSDETRDKIDENRHFHGGTMAAFRTLKALLALGHGSRELKLTLLIHKSHIVTREDHANPAHAGIIGLIGSLAKEYPRWQIRLLDFDFENAPSLYDCLSLPFTAMGSARGECFTYRNGEWFVPGLAALDSIPSTPPAFRQKGVYVVIGGAGGLGEAWSRYLIEKYQANLVWIGRSPLSPAIDAKIKSLTRNGNAPLYLSADASDPESLRKAYRVLADFHPTIHGVVHAAIVLEDKSLSQMDEIKFHNGFAAKADVALNMQRVFGSLDLDFMLFFSSMQSFYKAPGQSNYAAGCTFQDILAQQMDRDAAYPVKIVNWGYWGNIGVVSNDFYKQKMAEQGVGSIEIGEGMDFLEAFMGSRLPQVAAVKALDAKAFRDISLAETISFPAHSTVVRDAIRVATRTGSAAEIPDAFPELTPREPALGMLAGGLTATVMDELAAEILAVTLLTLSPGDNPFPALDEGCLRKICSRYLNPWMEASLKALREKGIIDARGRFASNPEKVDELWRQWEQGRAAWMPHEEIRAHVELLESCLKALPDIVTGARAATQVLFPESSLNRVQGVYSGNPVSDYYNDMMADLLTARMEAELRKDPDRKFRILEIGAGTGGTTARIIPKLHTLAASIAEYRFTDLSRAFLIHAQERFEKNLPSLDTTLLDIAKPLRAQGIEAGRYDFAIATNVLHATPDARESLRNAKAALKPAGLLLLNEISTWSLYNHLTFGLLEGWWLYQDPALRLAGSAALSPERWLGLLAEEGFTNIRTPAWEQRHLGQQIFLAHSDGVIRQKGLRLPLHETGIPSGTSPRRLQPNPSGPASPGQEDLRRRCNALLQRLAAETLRMDAGKIDPDAPLETYGLDSILILKFTDKLREIFSEVTSTVFFEVQTLSALADHFLRNNPVEVKAALPEEAGPRPSAPAGTEQAQNRTSVLDESTRPSRGPGPARILPERRSTAALRSPAWPDSSAKGAMDVAIVGLNGRYPKSPDLETFWRNLSLGVDCISEIPRDRWQWENYFDAEKGKPGKIYSKWGGFLEDIDKFDPLFFRISPKEAKRMDPQERLFLETAYRAIEDAGYTPGGLGNSEKIGVYVGVMNSRYSPQPYYFSIANRISYLFDFRGPSMAVDTACSSSLTAIHLAAESIVNGTCDCAIAGGVNLIIDPVHYLELSELTMLSSGSRCRSFGNMADGFVDAEGVGAVVLKSLCKAERDNDNIYAIIKGSAINAGGKTNGYTVPNPKAQAALVAGAIARSGLPACDLGYIEAHGTGTALGDPIEITALSNAFRLEQETNPACRIGSVKSNIGHCESAAGIAGLTKVLLQLKHGKLVPSLHADEVNPEIDFAKTPFTLQRRLEDWERIRRNRGSESIELPRAAGISSFGAGGANASLIVQEYIGPGRAAFRRGLPEARTFLVPLSARTQDQLRRKAEDLSEFLRKEGDDVSLASIAFTLQVGREAMGERLGILAGTQEELRGHLTAFLSGQGSSQYFSLGLAKANKEFLLAFRSDPNSQAALEKGIAEQNLTRLLELWAKGVDVPWEKLYPTGTPARVSLPSYPFARERYWEIRAQSHLGDDAMPRPAQPLGSPQSEIALHPLVHRNTSTVRNLQFTSRFRGDESFLMAPEGRTERHLSAGGYLEMAHAALDLAQPGKNRCFEMTDTDWAQPPVAIGNLELHIALLGEGENEMAFEIFSADDGRETIHCQGRGRILAENAPRRRDIPVSPGSGDDRAQWVRIEIPMGEVVQANGCFLRPNLLDRIFAAALNSGATERLLPGSLASLRIYSSTAASMMAWIRSAPESDEGNPPLRFDIDLCHPNGDICLQLTGLDYAIDSHEAGSDAVERVPELTPARPTPITTEAMPSRITLSLDSLQNDRREDDMALTVIGLHEPQNLVAEPSELLARSPISLSDLSQDRIEPEAHASPIRTYKGLSLSELGDGIFDLTVDTREERNLLTEELLAEFSSMLQALAKQPIKILILRGNGQEFLRGGAKLPELSLSLELCRALAAFPCPIIACMEGDADGAGWLLGALCDFMICNEEATYRWSTPEDDAPLFPGLLEFYRERFGAHGAEDFLCFASAYTGAQLRGLGWTCRILPKDQVGAYANQLAKELSTKPEKALRLLKQHLSRGIPSAVQGFRPIADAEAAHRHQDAQLGPEVQSPSGAFRITEIEPALLQVEIGADLQNGNCLSLLEDLHGLFAQLRGPARYRAVILTSAHSDFFPAPQGESFPTALSNGMQLVLDCPIPIIAAASGSLRGFAWLLALLCDGCVYASGSTYESGSFSETGSASRSGSLAEDYVPTTAARIFSHSFGALLGKEILLTGREYSGAELRRRSPACLVGEDNVLEMARERAMHWAKHPSALRQWRTHRLATFAARNTDPQQPIPSLELADSSQPAQTAHGLQAGQATPIALASRVVKATAHSDGILLIEMEDREAKNQFSPELIAGIVEVFAFLERTPIFKTAILTGYDTYFATGGTQESLFSIQAGKQRFTDQVISHLPMRCAIPVIAAVQGHAVGGGLSLAQFCDFKIFSEESKLVSPYMHYGFTPGAGATLVTPEVFGYDLGRESLLNSQEFEGSDLVRRGTTLPVVPRKQAVEQAWQLAHSLARRSRPVLAELKRCFTLELRDALEETYRLELGMHAQTLVGQAEARDRIGTNFSGREAAIPAADGVTSTLRYGSPPESQGARNIPPKPTIALTPAAVRSVIAELLAKELHLVAAEIEDDRQFVDLGLDSIVGVTWVRKINQKYATSIEAVRIYSYPTLQQFGDFVWEEAKRAMPQPALPAQANPFDVEARAETEAIGNVAAQARSPRAKSAGRKLASIRVGAGGLPSLIARHSGGTGGIAVIGMSGRFPKAKNLELFWKNIAEGRDCIEEIPPSRWDIGKYFLEGSAKPGKTNCKWMGALEDHDKFDPLFFNISPKEAIAMDPQQRVFLEACWHAIEFAGYNPIQLAGSRGGVFAGCSTGDYHQLSQEQKLSALGFTGGNCSILAARIAYFLDLLGPCLSIETACSSSLVAIATACDSLLAGTSDIALAGGVNVMSGPELHIKSAQSNMLSAHGKCFTFDGRADGFVPGEGIGVLLLKRLRDAEQDGDSIYGIIEGWGINQDGKTNGITAPKAESQRRLIQEVYEKYGIDPETIQLVEAHGTGTKLGDPIEVAALKDAFRSFTGKQDFCAIGSVKSNIGHTATAAGAAGVLKCLWALKEGKLPPTINFNRLNEHIDLEGSPFYVNTVLKDWRPHSAAPRRAAISSFGFGGTNCHLVVSEYRPKPVHADSGRKDPVVKAFLFPLSARTKDQLEQAARDLSEFISNGGSRPHCADLAYTLQVGRKPMEYRLGVMATSHAELRARLESFLAGNGNAAANTGADAEAIYFGKTAGKNDGIQVISSDAELKETLTLKWLQSGKLHKLLELWVRGVEIDWNLLYGRQKPKRTALTLYPFARQRYWIESSDGSEPYLGGLPSAVSKPILHPLLHQNISDLRQLAFQSDFSGQESFWNWARFENPPSSEMRILPASAQLEMMAAALTRITGTNESARPLKLSDIRWDRTPGLQPGSRIKVELFDRGADGLAIEIGKIGEDSSVLFCQALGAVLPETAMEIRMDPAGMRARMRRWESDAIQSGFKRLGYGHGPDTSGVMSMHAGSGEMLVGLRNPATARTWEKALRIDPMLLQLALECLGLLEPASEETLLDPWSPAGIDSIEIGARFGKDMFCWIRKAAGRESDSRQNIYDLDMFDAEGRPSIRIRGIRFAGEAIAPSITADDLSVSNAYPSESPAIEPDSSSHLQKIERELQASLAQALYLEQADTDPDTLFTDLGMDSIIGVEWVDALNKQYGLRLSGTVVYQFPTLKKLAKHLDQARMARQGNLPVETTADVPTTAAPDMQRIVATAPATSPGLVRAELRADLIASLTLLLAEALYLQPDEIDKDTLFTDLGMDSIIGVEWMSALNKKHGTALSATVLYQYPTITRLAAFLEAEMAKRAAALPPAASPSSPADAPEVRIASRPQPTSALPKSGLETFRKAGPVPERKGATPSAPKPQGIAVIGMAGRFPQAEDTEAFWRNIRDGKNCITEIPESRWRHSEFYRPGKPAQGKYYSRWMGAIDGVECFDPSFFNISPTEAKSMDPQQRLFLQTCWHCIENAGYSSGSLSESRCGVYVGASKGDYLHLSKEHELSSQGFTGGAISILAARASYFLNLLGPCVTIDTACSSALVAIASACDSLIARTSDLGLAGGVFIMSSPEMHIMTSQAGMLSTEGGCLAFDSKADGFVPADGVGMVILKRLEDAERDSDNILGVIEGWGVNQDGKTNGITAPNAASQTRLIQDVYDRFGIDAEEIQLVEAHGTGTKLGDPIEIDALKQAFGKYTRKTGYCAVGSVKSNIGHALTAAGMAGVIKVLQALQRRKLPPTIRVSEVNRYIELADSPFYINTTLKDWEVPAGRSRKAAVSSFGFSGTNTHLVISEYVARQEAEAPVLPRTVAGRLPIPLSAKTREQLLRKAGDLLQFLATSERIPDLERLAYTFQVGRDPMPYRLAVAAGDIGELVDALRAFLADRKLPGTLWEGKVGAAEARFASPSADSPPASAEQQARDGRPESLLNFWIQGGEIDWSRLYPGRKPRRMPLPGYPFAEQRLWIDKPYALSSGSSYLQSPGLHPLLQRNTSNLERQSYSLTLSGEEPFLNEHRLKLPGKDAQRLLPGAAYLEMARAAFSLALPEGTQGRIVALQDVVWMNPLFVEQETEITIALYGYAEEDEGNPGVSFEIFSAGTAGEIIHCRGAARLVDSEAPANVHLSSLSARMRSGKAEHGEIYASFANNGLIYGPSHQCIASISMGEGEALASMERMSKTEEADRGEYVMAPNLLDGALQSSIGLLWRSKDRQVNPLVPFSVSKLIVYSTCEEATHVWVRRAKRSTATGGDLELDIDLLDGDGRTCIRVEGFSFREFRPRHAARRESPETVAELGQAMEEPGTAEAFDVELLLEQVMNKRISIEDAAELL